MRNLVLGAAALLGLAALGTQGASAQGLSIVADFGGYGYGGPRVVEEYRSPRFVDEYRAPRREWRDTSWRHDGYRPHHGWGYGRPVGYGHGYGRPVGYGESGCVVKIKRYFDGYSTVTEKKRICR